MHVWTVGGGIGGPSPLPDALSSAQQCKITLPLFGVNRAKFLTCGGG